MGTEPMTLFCSDYVSFSVPMFLLKSLIKF